jgi:hypothetical protein
MSLIGQTVSRFSNQTVTLGRKTGFWDSGRYVLQGDPSSTFQANVQPLRGDELQRLPEAYRKQGAIVLFTLTELRTGTVDTVADRVVYDGDEYEIFTVEKWRQHYRYIATRAQQ